MNCCMGFLQIFKKVVIYLTFTQIFLTIFFALLLYKLKPPYLKARMKDLVQCRKNEQFDKTNFNLRMQEVPEQASHLQHEKRPYHAGTLFNASSKAERRLKKRKRVKLEKRVNPKTSRQGLREASQQNLGRELSGCKKKDER